MAPRHKGKGAAAKRANPPSADSGHGSGVAAATVATAIPPFPQTPTRQRGSGPFAQSRVPVYSPPKLTLDPNLDDGEDFDFQEADAVPITPGPTTQTRLPPAVGAFGSPVKRARMLDDDLVTMGKRSDKSVWDEPDEVILNAASRAWWSDVYRHYDVTVNRVYDGSQKVKIEFVFTCKEHPEHHTAPLRRDRQKTGDGTKKFLLDVKKCEEKQGIYQPSQSTAAALPYSAENHRALIALRCAKSARPANEVMDEEYRMEVNMLRPGTVIPHPTTIQQDLINIYIHMSTFVFNYFANLHCAVHFALDGWTSPLVSSYLGLVVIWYADGVINRAVLEFIRLTSSHTGEYLAEVTAKCLKRYGLESKILGICMDNASNCNTLASHLPNYIPHFRGPVSRLCCMAHVINLIAKIFISFFFKKLKRQKLTAASEPDIFAATPTTIDEEDIAAEEEAELDAQVEQDDEGQIAHDESTVKSIHDQAINSMRWGTDPVIMTKAEEEIALGIFPKISGLARRVHDNSNLNLEFKALVERDPQLQSSANTSLTRRVPTRWNSDFDCLYSHLYFEKIVQSLTGVSSNKLKAYRLSDEQWLLAKDLQAVLVLFKDLTELFSKSDVPLVVDAIPMLLLLRQRMSLVVDDTPVGGDYEEGEEDEEFFDDEGSDDDGFDPNRPTPPVIRIAAMAAVLFIDKYLNLFWECEIYSIAIHQKLIWFKDVANFDSTCRKQIHTQAASIFNNRYDTKSTSQTSPESAQPVQKTTRTRKQILESSKWLATGQQAAAEPSRGRGKKKTYPYDHIESYLSEPVMSAEAVAAAGGYLKYWETAKESRPILARMALDYISAPASSVDAERAFSSGRRQVNFMQHNMSSRTFQSRVTVGSWAKTSLFPGVEAVADMIANGPPETDLD